MRLTDLVKYLHAGLHDPITHPEGHVAQHVLIALRKALQLNPDKALLLAVLFHDSGKPLTQIIYNPLKIRHPDHEKVSAILVDILLNSKLKEKVKWLVRHHMLLRDWDKLSPKTKKKIALHPEFKNLIKLHVADISARLF